MWQSQVGQARDIFHGFKRNILESYLPLRCRFYFSHFAVWKKRVSAVPICLSCVRVSSTADFLPAAGTFGSQPALILRGTAGGVKTWCPTIRLLGGA